MVGFGDRMKLHIDSEVIAYTSVKKLSCRNRRGGESRSGRSRRGGGSRSGRSRQSGGRGEPDGVSGAADHATNAPDGSSPRACHQMATSSSSELNGSGSEGVDDEQS